MVYLKLVAEVDDDGVAHWWDVDPTAVLEELEAANLVVLEEEDEATGIGVSPEAFDEIGLGTRRVVANFGSKVWAFGPIKHLLQIPFLQPQILTQQVKKHLCQLLQFHCKFLHCLPDTHKKQYTSMPLLDTVYFNSQDIIKKQKF